MSKKSKSRQKTEKEDFNNQENLPDIFDQHVQEFGNNQVSTENFQNSVLSPNDSIYQNDSDEMVGEGLEGQGSVIIKIFISGAACCAKQGKGCL